MKYIIGSGLVGLLARHILGGDWKLIKQGLSRYYTRPPVLADNFIRVHDNVGPIVSQISPMAMAAVQYKRAFSLAGQLMYNENSLTVNPYITKLYGDLVPPTAREHFQTTFWVYNMSCVELYRRLLDKYKDEILDVKVLGVDIEERLIRGNVRGNIDKLDYDSVVCTVPLNVLYDWAGITGSLSSKHVCYYHIESDKIDLEGADQCMVCDENYVFFKVSPADDRYKLGNKKDYIFWTFDTVDNPHEYFGMFLGYDLDIKDAFRISDAIPLGRPPKLSVFEDSGIWCVGSNAQWDDFMDISSCIRRLVRLRDGN